MKKRNISYFFALITTILPFQVGAEVLIANSVQPGTKRILRTVATDHEFQLSSAVISSELCGRPAGTPYRQRILKSGRPITSYISLGPGGSFEITFNPIVIFNAGETIEVQNKDNSEEQCRTNFTLQGSTYRITPPQ